LIKYLTAKIYKRKQEEQHTAQKDRKILNKNPYSHQKYKFANLRTMDRIPNSTDF